MDWQTISGISSTIIALCALIFTILQNKRAQKHNKLSFRPHLTSWTHKNSGNGFYAVELMNNGIGPALIESFTIKVDGKIISGEETEPIEKALKILFPKIDYQSRQSYFAKGYSMGAKEKMTLVAIQFTEKPPPTPEVVNHAFNRTDLIVNYKSFYEEPFTYSTADEK